MGRPSSGSGGRGGRRDLHLDVVQIASSIGARPTTSQERPVAVGAALALRRRSPKGGKIQRSTPQSTGRTSSGQITQPRGTPIAMASGGSRRRTLGTTSFSVAIAGDQALGKSRGAPPCSVLPMCLRTPSFPDAHGGSALSPLSSTTRLLWMAAVPRPRERLLHRPTTTRMHLRRAPRAPASIGTG